MLRSRGGPWKLTDAGYVHGIVQGEAFDRELCGEVSLV